MTEPQEELDHLEYLQRRMEAAWCDLTATELRCRPGNRRSILRAERAYDRYLAAMDAYMRYVATQPDRTTHQAPAPLGAGVGTIV